jgi:hypothetical protein
MRLVVEVPRAKDRGSQYVLTMKMGLQKRDELKHFELARLPTVMI